MPVTTESSQRIVSATIEGNVFPTTERETIQAVVVDGAKGIPAWVRGAVYGRTVKILGNARIDGPIVSRGDTRIEPRGELVRLLSGITVNGSLNVALAGAAAGPKAVDPGREAAVLIKGDAVASHNLHLNNTVVFGSIRAQNCRVERSIVLGTIVAAEKLTICRSAIAGYAASEVTFEGPCTMIHALGESRARPLFVPHEEAGVVSPSDLRYYPALRFRFGFLNRGEEACNEYPAHSRLDPDSDWVSVMARHNAALDAGAGESPRWVLSLGGRVGDFAAIQDSIDALSEMLKCGFEFEHYLPDLRPTLLERALARLNPEEQWILRQVCELS